jgi:two-component system, LytTR family, response regulator
MKINCIAIDDELPALNQMQDYISKIPYLNLVGSFNNGLDALNFLKENTVDLLFLDVQMDDLNGIQLLQVLNNKPKVILTTAYDQYALKAFDLEVSDYLLKPISFERFVKAVEKIYRELDGKTQESVENSESTESRNYFFVKTEFKMVRIDFDEIIYIEGLKEYLIIKTISGKVLSLMTFKEIIDILPEDNFVRTHKSYIVAINKIESIERNRIKIGEKLIPVGNTFKDEFYKRISKA